MTADLPPRDGTGRRFQPWPWALGGVFVLFFAIQAFMIATVSRGFEGPDDMQYYRHGLEYGQVVRQQARQRELGWVLTTNLPTRLVAGAPFPLEATLRDAAGSRLAGARVDVRMGRPATQRDDQRLGLAEEAPGVYRAPLAVGPGVWEFQFTLRRGGETMVERVRVRADPRP